MSSGEALKCTSPTTGGAEMWGRNYGKRERSKLTLMHMMNNLKPGETLNVLKYNSSGGVEVVRITRNEDGKLKQLPNEKGKTPCLES